MVLSIIVEAFRCLASQPLIIKEMKDTGTVGLNLVRLCGEMALIKIPKMAKRKERHLQLYIYYIFFLTFFKL